MKKLGISAVAFGLVCAMLLCILANVLVAPPDDDITNKPQFSYSGIDETRKYYGFDYVSEYKTAPMTHGTETSFTRDGGVSSYSVNGNLVTYEFCGGQDIVYNVYFNGKLIYEGVYLNGDGSLDMVFSGENFLNYLYDDAGNLNGIIANGGSVDIIRDGELRVTDIKLNGQSDHSYEYIDGVIARESFDGRELVYHYDENGGLISENEAPEIQKNGNALSLTQNGDVYEYVFGYSCSDRLYVTEIKKNGSTVSEYTYLNGKITSATVGDKAYYYVVDYSGNYLGYVCDGEFYLFVYNGFGAVYCILNSAGEPAAFVNAGAYGDRTVSIQDESYSVSGSIVYSDAIVDTESGNICVPDGIILSECGQRVSVSGKNAYALTVDDGLFDTRGGELKLAPMTAELLFRDRVVDDVIKRFSEKGLSAASYVDVMSEGGETVMTADIYCLDYSDSSGSTQNLFNGNQIYSVVRNAEGIGIERIDTLKMINENTSAYHVNYFGDFPVKTGSMSFGGQFVYLGYLITYNCDGDGIIYYSVNEACEDNYKAWNNIYDYDAMRYINYSEMSFSASIWDYTEIVPGMNREHYAAVEGFLDDLVLMQGKLEQESLEYIDESFFSAEHYNSIGDTLELYSSMMTEDQMIVLSSDGELTVQALPFWDSPSVHRNIIKMVGTVAVAVTVAAVVTFTIPGSAAFVMPILHTTLVSATVNAAQSFLISTLIQVDLSDLENTDWSTVLKNSFQNVGDKFIQGAITGAIFGTIKYGSRALAYNRSTNGLLFKNNSMRIESLDKTFDSLVVNDDMYAAMEYGSYKLMIESNTFDKVARAVITQKNIGVARKSIDFTAKWSVGRFVKKVIK